MATLGSILNKIECGASAALGTGTKGCKVFLQKVTTVWLTPAGFKYDSSQEFDETYINTLKAEGNLIVVKGIKTFADNTPDDSIEELEDGTKQVTRQGLYEFLIQFINGLYFNAALHSLSSFGNYDVTFIDKKGNVLGTSALDGSFKGFTMGMFQATKLKWATDTESGREGAMLQLTERAELDSAYYYIQNSQLDYNPNLIDGVNEVLLSYASVPADAGTNVSIKAVLKQDGSVFTGAVFGDFLHTIDGVTAAVTAGDDSAVPGTYELTVPALAANEVSAIQLYDTSNSREVIVVDTDSYKSNIPSSTVI